MAGNDSIFAFSTPKPRRSETLRTAPAQAVPQQCDEHDVVLDMGEASRLEGFRQNGCR